MAWVMKAEDRILGSGNNMYKGPVVGKGMMRTRSEGDHVANTQRQVLSVEGQDCEVSRS